MQSPSFALVRTESAYQRQRKALRPWFATKKVGGLRFVRVGALSLSFCITKKN